MKIQIEIANHSTRCINDDDEECPHLVHWRRGLEWSCAIFNSGDRMDELTQTSLDTIPLRWLECQRAEVSDGEQCPVMVSRDQA